MREFEEQIDRVINAVKYNEHVHYAIAVIVGFTIGLMI